MERAAFPKGAGMKDAEGHEFQVHKVQQDGTVCARCKRVIRVREQGAFLLPNGPWVCRDCLYAEPLTKENTWRRDRIQDKPVV
jgi:hypothetical protein